METATLRRDTDAADGRSSPSAGIVTFRSPVLEDGPRIHALIAACPPLDVNSAYCNLLQCSHFAGTCVVAERDGEVVGWISGYRPPDEPETFFVWQVAVSASARGEGLASRMLDELMSRPAPTPVRWLKTTITEDNGASWALFTRFARERSASLEAAPWMLAGQHLPDGHDSETLVTIGPITARPPG